MNTLLEILVGVLGGMVLNASEEKMKLFGYGKVAFAIQGKTIGYDDLFGIGIGVVMLFYRPSRLVGAGVITGMLYTKFAEGTSLPVFKFE